MRDRQIFCQSHYALSFSENGPGFPGMALGPGGPGQQCGLPLGMPPGNVDPMFCYPTPPPNPGDPMNPQKGSGLFYNGNPTPQKGRPRKRKQKEKVKRSVE